MSHRVLTEMRDCVGLITLNRPEQRNAIDDKMIESIRNALGDALADPSVRVILILGAGSAFCAGIDLKQTAANADSAAVTESVQTQVDNLQDVTRLIVGTDKIVIAAVQGWAIGAGFEWVINCDFSVWARTARAFFPEVAWGLSASGGVSALLPRMVGPVKAREMLLFGEQFGAEQLLNLGIAYRVVEEDALVAEALNLAARIGALPQAAVRRCKRSINSAVLRGLEQSLADETDALVESMADAGMLEKVRQF